MRGIRVKAKLVAKFTLGPYKEEWVNVAKDPRHFNPDWGPLAFCSLDHGFLIGTDLKPPSLWLVNSRGVVLRREVKFLPGISHLDVKGNKIVVVGWDTLGLFRWEKGNLKYLCHAKVFKAPNLSREGYPFLKVKLTQNDLICVARFTICSGPGVGSVFVKLLKFEKVRLREVRQWRVPWIFSLFPGFLGEGELLAVDDGILYNAKLGPMAKVKKVRIKEKGKNLYLTGQVVGRIGSQIVCDCGDLYFLTPEGEVIKCWKVPWYRYSMVGGQRFFVSPRGKIYMIGELHGRTPSEVKWHNKGNLWWCEWGIFELVPP